MLSELPHSLSSVTGGANSEMKNAYTETAAASRYNCARALPADTRKLWLETISDLLPKDRIKKVLDLGCGTGRFTVALGEHFNCGVIGVEPSAAMLNIARSQPASDVEWKEGAAEKLPVANESIDLVFMSQVFHHLVKPHQAFEEIHRVLKGSGYLAIRNGMREENDKLPWLAFFPEARLIEEARTPLRSELKELVTAHRFSLLCERVIQQRFASSHEEYVEKIGQRGLSALIAISDDAFQTGLANLRRWATEQPPNIAVYEPVDLFIFQKMK